MQVYNTECCGPIHAYFCDSIIYQQSMILIHRTQIQISYKAMRKKKKMTIAAFLF